MESEAAAIIAVYESLSATEAADIDMFLSLERECVTSQQKRDLIKSFRRQMIVVGAAVALEPAAS